MTRDTMMLGLACAQTGLLFGISFALGSIVSLLKEIADYCALIVQLVQK